MAMVTTFGRRLAPAIALVLTACAAPTVVVTPPAPGVPHISALTVEPGRLKSGCPITFRLTFEDAGRDVTRAVARWWARTGYSRYDEGTDVLPFAPAQFEGKSDGLAEVVIIPPDVGNYVYRIHLEDAQGQTSNVAEARVYVERHLFWWRPRCQAPSGDR